MAISKLWQVYYTVCKSTTKGTEESHSECYVEAETLTDALAKFAKTYPDKRGYTYDITGIYRHNSDVIK